MALPLILLLLLGKLFAAFPEEVTSRVLYMTHHGQIENALAQYLEHAKEHEEHDFDLLQTVGETILERGSSSADPEAQLLCLFGAGVAQSPHFIPTLERGVKSPDMKSQLIALNFLSRYQDDSADSILVEALNSPFLLTRLEACYQLAIKRNPIVVDHLEALYYKVPPVVRILFPQIVAFIDTPAANGMMRHYLSDKDFIVRTEALVNIAKHKRDDFLPQVRTMAQQAHFVQQEAAAWGLGEMRDRSALPILQQLATSKQEEVRLPALVALYRIGETAPIDALVAEARAHNLFAIAALGHCQEKAVVDLLLELVKSSERDVAFNAALALLEQKNSACLEVLEKLLANRDVGFIQSRTPAGSLSSWKVVLSVSQKDKKLAGLAARSEALRNEILLRTIELPEEAFLPLARLLFEKQDNQMVPLLVELLANHRTTKTVELLKEMQQKAGAPFIRNFCTLALYKIGEKGHYEEKLIEWIEQSGNTLLIQLKEERAKERQTHYKLTPEESSRFFIEALEALLMRQSTRGIETLIHTIAHGNPKNRYALAGLLIRTTE